MKSRKPNHPFKDNQTGYHRSAVDILKKWTGGKKEYKFYLNGKYFFVPDVTVFKNKIPVIIYEVIHKNEFTGKKLGKIQFWCYCNAINMKVYEVSADWILSQTKKPKKIKVMECYNI